MAVLQQAIYLVKILVAVGDPHIIQSGIGIGIHTVSHHDRQHGGRHTGRLPSGGAGFSLRESPSIHARDQRGYNFPVVTQQKGIFGHDGQRTVLDREFKGFACRLAAAFDRCYLPAMVSVGHREWDVPVLRGHR